MHALQLKHTKLKKEELEKLLLKYNISLNQLPKIKITDPALPLNCSISDVVKIEGIIDNEKRIYFRVVTI